MWTALGLLGGAAIAGGSALYSSSQQNSAITSLNRKTREFNAAEAQKQRDWQEEMANTQYQRMVKDLRAAGLNPLLATGASPSVPSGAAASAGTPLAGDYSGIEKAGSAFGNAIRSIVSKEVDKARSEAAKTAGEVINTEKTGRLLDAQIQNVAADTVKKSSDTLKSDAETTRTKVGTFKDVVAPIASSAATAYAGKKAGDAAKALVGAGLTKNSAQEIIKEVAPKAASSARQSSSLWPVLGGMLGVGLPVGAGGLMFNAEKADYEKGKRDKKHAAERARRNDTLMNAL